KSGMKFDLLAYSSLICGLCRCGRMVEARNYFNEMITNGVHPDDIIYGCLVKKYYELGNTREAEELQNDMVGRQLMNGISE
nr:putative pentatricopeptide repeat-containing protein At2g02150 [Tanacetum cinerariifolium]